MGVRGFSPYPTRRDRYSVLAALSSDGWLGWAMTEGAYNADKFYDAFMRVVLPHMNPFPGPRSVFVLDGATIRKDPRIHNAIASLGGVSVILPPYSPEYNPIEKVFAIVKRYACATTYPC